MLTIRHFFDGVLSFFRNIFYAHACFMYDFCRAWFWLLFLKITALKRIWRETGRMSPWNGGSGIWCWNRMRRKSGTRILRRRPPRWRMKKCSWSPRLAWLAGLISSWDPSSGREFSSVQPVNEIVSSRGVTSTAHLICLRYKFNSAEISAMHSIIVNCWLLFNEADLKILRNLWLIWSVSVGDWCWPGIPQRVHKSLLCIGRFVCFRGAQTCRKCGLILDHLDCMRTFLHDRRLLLCGIGHNDGQKVCELKVSGKKVAHVFYCLV